MRKMEGHNLQIKSARGPSFSFHLTPFCYHHCSGTYRLDQLSTFCSLDGIIFTSRMDYTGPALVPWCDTQQKYLSCQPIPLQVPLITVVMTWPRFFSFFPTNVIIYLCSRRFKYICMYACMNFLFWKIILNHLKNTFAIHMSCFGVQKIQLCQLCPGVRNRITTLTAVPSPGHAQPWERRPRVPCFITELSKVIWGNLLSWAWAISQGVKRVIWFPHLRSVPECS